jgi:hypothetical protein
VSITTARGVGDCFIETVGLGNGTSAQQWMIPIGVFNFEESVETESVEAQQQIGGVLQTAEAGQSSITRTLTLTTQILNRNTRPLVFQQLPKTFTDFEIKIRKDGTVNNALKIVDPLITVDNLPFINVFKNGFGKLNRTATSSTAPASANEVQIDTAAGEMVFFTGEAGVGITYTVPLEVSTAQGYGGTGAKTSLARFSFSAVEFGLNNDIVGYRYYPAIDLVTPPSVALSGDIPELTFEFTATTPDGWTDPFRYIEASSIVLPSP